MLRSTHNNAQSLPVPFQEKSFLSLSVQTKTNCQILAESLKEFKRTINAKKKAA
jgi:hypothetical protein